MAKRPKLNSVLQRYNQGCSFYQRAFDAWKAANMSDYENALRSAATDTIGALEWALKIYLRSIRRDAIAEEDAPKLKQPNFHDLMILMQEYADPPINGETVDLLYDYRALLRNTAEHDASIPPSGELRDAIQEVRKVILTYLPIEDEQLGNPSEPITPDYKLEQLKAEYFDMLRSSYEYMDLGGISPRVGNRVVKIRMEDLFVPLRVTETGALFESLPEETGVDSSGFYSDPLLATKETPETIQSEETGILEYQQLALNSDQTSLEMARIFEKQRVVVLGDPGSGKTTVGKYVAYSVAAAKTHLVGDHLKQHIPLLVRATDYASLLKERPDLSFFDYITREHTVRYGRLFEKALETGKCLIIIDGLDEVQELQTRIGTSKRIEQFVSEFRTNRFLITSRIVGYRRSRLAGDFVHATLSEFNEQQILRFLEQWYQAIEAEAETAEDAEDAKRRASHLWDAIEANAGIRKLAGNPLLLTIVALANWRGTRLPNKRAELYQIATETLIENWPLQQRGITLDSEEILEILDPIAFHIHESGKNNLITRRELRPLFESKVREARGVPPGEAKNLSRRLLETIGEHTGFFLEKGLDQSGQSVYGFLHLTFAEYLAARHLAEQWSSGELNLADYAHSARWREVVLLIAGHVSSWSTTLSTRFVTDVLKLDSPYEEILHFDLLRAAEILGENVRVKRDAQDGIVSQLISIALETPHQPLWRSIEIRLQQMSRVLHLGGPAQRLSIRSEDGPAVRARKALLLAALAEVDSEELPFLVLQGWSDSSEASSFLFFSRLHHFEALLNWSLPQEPVTHILWTVFTGGLGVPQETANRIRSLRVPTFGVHELIYGSLTLEKEQDRRRLGLIDCRELLDLGTSPIASLLASTKQGLANLVVAALVASEAYTEFCNDLVDWSTSDETAEARIMALDALAKATLAERLTQQEGASTSQWIERIRPIALSDADPMIRAAAFAALSGLSREEDLIDELRPAFRDPTDVVRSKAIRLSTQPHSRYSYSQKQPPLTEEVKMSLQDASPDVRHAAALTLIRENQVTEEYIPALLDGLMAQPTTLMSENENRRWFDDLVILCNELRSFESTNAIGVRLKEIIESDILPSFASIVTTNAEEKLLAAVFGAPAVPRPIEELADVMSSLFVNSDPDTRRKAVNVWAHARSEATSVIPLLPLLDDSDVNVKTQAYEALRPSDVSDPRIVDLLLLSLTDDLSDVADTAATVLSEMAEPELVEEIVGAVARILNQDPTNEHAFRVLWRLW